MKCDEARPHCYNCTRLNKHCVYSLKPRFRFEIVDNIEPYSNNSSTSNVDSLSNTLKNNMHDDVTLDLNYNGNDLNDSYKGNDRGNILDLSYKDLSYKGIKQERIPSINQSLHSLPTIPPTPLLSSHSLNHGPSLNHALTGNDNHTISGASNHALPGASLSGASSLNHALSGASLNHALSGALNHSLSGASNHALNGTSNHASSGASLSGVSSLNHALSDLNHASNVASSNHALSGASLNNSLPLTGTSNHGASLPLSASSNHANSLPSSNNANSLPSSNYANSLPTGASLPTGTLPYFPHPMTIPLPKLQNELPSLKPSPSNSVTSEFKSNLSIEDWRLLFGEAKLLVNDLNEINFPDYDNSLNNDLPEINCFDIIDFNHYASEIEDLRLTNTELINKIVEHHNLQNPHVNYLKALSNTDLSYHLFPFASSVDSNEVVKLLLKYSHTCDYLLSSLLAISATFQYNQSGNKIHDISTQKYTTISLQLLSKTFENAGLDKKDVIAQEIERLLLTVLVLTSNFTSNTKNNLMDSWKIHLKGARDLLLNYGQLANSSLYITSGLAVAQTWFFSLEALAGLYTPNGGTLSRSENDLGEDNSSINSNNLSKVFNSTGYFNRIQNSAYNNALSRINLLTDQTNQLENYQEFNLYCGFTTRVVKLIEEVIYALAFVRENPLKSISPKRVCEILSLINSCYETEIVPGFNKETYRIPQDSPGHPNYVYLNKINLPISAYGKLNKTEYFSWFDLSEQVRTDCIYLRFITTPGLLGLSGNHPLAKQVIKKIMASLIFLKLKSSEEYIQDLNLGNVLVETENYYLSSESFDNRVIMIQSPYRLTSKFVDSEQDFEKLELFFLGLVKQGNGSSLSALDILSKYRRRWRSSIDRLKNADSPQVEDDVELEIIPFA